MVGTVGSVKPVRESLRGHLINVDMYFYTKDFLFPLKSKGKYS